MVKRILAAFLLSPLIFIVSCSLLTGGTVTESATPGKPLIDTRTPAAYDTATFALG
jgi:hypothetical protein